MVEPIGLLMDCCLPGLTGLTLGTEIDCNYYMWLDYLSRTRILSRAEHTPVGICGLVEGDTVGSTSSDEGLRLE